MTARWSYVGPRAPSGRGDASEVTRARTGLHATQETAMPDRPPKILRRREAVERTYSFLGHQLRPGMAARWPAGIPLWDNTDGSHLYRIPRCTCGRPVPDSSLDGFSCAEHDQEVAE